MEIERVVEPQGCEQKTFGAIKQTLGPGIKEGGFSKEQAATTANFSLDPWQLLMRDTRSVPPMI
jgi:hypothetical protein